MEEITIRLYDYDELSDEAKRRAREDWRSKDPGHFRGGEVRHTLKELEKEFGIEVSDWTYDSYSYDCGMIRFKELSDGQLALAGERARAFLWNNFGHPVMQPRVSYHSRLYEKRTSWFGEGLGTRRFVSKVFFDRTYDGTCPLTGVYFDSDALDPLACFCFGVRWDEREKRRVMVPHGERWRWKSKTVEEAIRECVGALFGSAQKDCEYQESEEIFAETCAANGWTFEEDGTRRDVA